MKKENKKGFTLIELLVVVLIIGVLAAIALPQYKKAVWKSRATNLQTQISAIGDAIQRYYLVHDTWASEFDDLDIDIAGESTEGILCNLSNSEIKESDYFTLRIEDVANTAYAIFTKGPYNCSGFGYYSSIFSGKTLLCIEVTKDTAFNGNRGDFCEKVMGYSFYKNQGSIDWFTD